MAVNQYLPFGTGPGAPVLSNAAYAALPPSAAFPAGILLKEHLNKALRQACTMASAVGEYIASTGVDALDDGNVPALALALAQALDGQFSTSANRPITGAAYHDFHVPADDLIAVLALTAGTWLIDATACSFNARYNAQSLSIDGVAVQSITDGGDPEGTDCITLGGFHEVIIAPGTSRSVPVTWSQASGADSRPMFVKAIAFKVG